jgi:arginine exporter protein ArgO
VIVPARILGAALLVLIALRGLAGAVAAARQGRPGEGAATGVGAAAGTAGGSAERPAGAAAGTRSVARTYLLFLGLTIVNPLTLLYFAALMLGLPVATGGEGRLLFVVGALGASLSWQWLLAAAGALLHGRLPDRVQAFTGAVGSVIVLGFAARLLLAT